jgi:hypothetical protein
MGNVWKHNICTDVLLSQTFRPYFRNLSIKCHKDFQQLMFRFIGPKGNLQ